MRNHFAHAEENAVLIDGNHPAPVLGRAIGDAIYGSTEAFAAECMAEVAAGKLCGTDMPVLLDCLRRWETEGSWDVRRATGNGTGVDDHTSHG